MILAMVLLPEMSYGNVIQAVPVFFHVFLGGIAVGALVAIPVSELMVKLHQEGSAVPVVISLVIPYLCFILAEHAFQVSGVMAVLVTGLIMGRVIHNDFQDERGSFVDTFWSFNVYVAEALVFLLMGVTVGLNMFAERWLAMLIGIVAILAARAVGVFGTAPLINRLPWVEEIPMGFQQILFIGSLRGAVVLALGLSLPLDLPYWWTIQSIAFGVVIFSLFVQAPLVDPLLRRSHLVGKETGSN
jgi:CPA1 family monovalent cation:H+ antiporter